MKEVVELSKPECGRAHGLLPGFVDGDLSAEQAGWLGGHLELCPDCRAELVRFTAIDSGLTDWGRQLEAKAPVPTDERERLRSRLSPVRQPVMIRLILAMAAAMALCALVVVVISHPEQPASPGAMQFVGIPYLPPLDPRENRTVLRMNIPVANLIAAGYRVAGDPNVIVPADVLVGEDGRAHAVRVLGDVRLN